MLLPTHLGLTIHESIGHSTELDRALGYEANFAGTSFLTTDKLGRFRVGSEIVNVYGDRILPRALSTCGYDDDGVKTKRWHILKDGIFVGYQTTREQARWIGQDESTGCSYADSYASIPFQRMPNVWLEAGKKPMTLDDLVAGVLDRPPALQLPVRRRRLLGDQEGEGRRPDRRRRLPEPHPRLLAGVRRHRRRVDLVERRAEPRRQGGAGADQRHEPRLRPEPLPWRQRHPDGVARCPRSGRATG